MSGNNYRKIDTVIVGAGVFGLASAILAASRGENVLVIEKYAKSNKVNNYRAGGDFASLLEKLRDIVVENTPADINLLVQIDKLIGVTVTRASDDTIFRDCVYAEHLDKVLLDIARIFPSNIQIQRLAEVSGVDVEQRIVAYKPKTSESDITIATNRVIFADGAHTSAPRLLGEDLFDIKTEVKNPLMDHYHMNGTFEIDI